MRWALEGYLFELKQRGEEATEGPESILRGQCPLSADWVAAHGLTTSP